MFSLSGNFFIFFVESDTMKTFTSKYNQAKWPSWTVCF